MYYAEDARIMMNDNWEINNSERQLAEIEALGDSMTGDDYACGCEISQYVGEFYGSRDYHKKFLLTGKR